MNFVSEASGGYVAITDYRMGNLFSVYQAVVACGLDARITDDEQEILGAAAVILPGVGAFADAMRFLKASGLDRTLRTVAERGTPLIGICLGQQLLMSESNEMGHTEGLGIIEGNVERLPVTVNTNTGRKNKVPHVGWSRLTEPRPGAWRGTALREMENDDMVYFVHSYCSLPINSADVLAEVTYSGVTFAAAVQRENVLGFQFHPEQSGECGLAIYRALFKSILTRGSV